MLFSVPSHTTAGIYLVLLLNKSSLLEASGEQGISIQNTKHDHEKVISSKKVLDTA